MTITKNDTLQNKANFLNVKPIRCIDCGEIIELPSHRIKTNNGWQWLCDDCRGKTNN